MKKMISCAALLASINLSASTVAIIDSGTDMKHVDIAPQAWMNPVDTSENGNDEDGNGFVDDIFGWNFANNNNQVIDYKYLGRLTADVRKFFEVQARMIKGTATASDRQWMSQKRSDQNFIKQLGVYGNFMHGTHVGSIAIKGSKQAKLLAVKLIPTEASVSLKEFKAQNPAPNGFGAALVKMFLQNIAKRQVDQLTKIADYVGKHNSDVANGSFGIGFRHAKAIVKQIAAQFGAQMSSAEIEQLAKDFLTDLAEKTKGMMAAAPNTFFVFAAGNEGTNNDIYPTSPTNAKADNAISVAATIGFSAIAPFSCFGTSMVEVAAPGVAINAAVPGDKYLPVSGTSQAAPYVANVASQVKDMNPSLTPLQMKEILIGTVDKKGWLQAKVKSGGIVNSARAIAAAELSKTMSVAQAIAEARTAVQDNLSPRSLLPSVPSLPEGIVLPLPSSIVFNN